MRELGAAKDPAAREAAGRDVLAAKQALEALAPGPLKSAHLADVRQRTAENENEEEQKEAAAQRITSTAELGHVGHQASQVLRGALIDAIVGALKGLDDQLCKEARVIAGDPDAKPLEVKRVILEVAVKAATSGLTESRLKTLKSDLRKGLQALIRKLLEEKYPGLSGAARLAEGPIDTLVNDAAKGFKLDELLEELFDPLMARVLGMQESGSGEGKEVGGANRESKLRADADPPDTAPLPTASYRAVARVAPHAGT